MVFVIDDNEIMAQCIAEATCAKTRIFTNAIDAMDAIAGGQIPKMVFLDILLDGPDGFTFLHEMVSYDDTRKIPVIIVSSLGINRDLSMYGVVGVLSKDTMRPDDIKRYVEKYAK